MQIIMSSIGAEQIRLRIFIGIFREKAYRRVSSGGIFIVLVLWILVLWISEANTEFKAQKMNNNNEQDR